MSGCICEVASDVETNIREKYETHEDGSVTYSQVIEYKCLPCEAIIAEEIVDTPETSNYQESCPWNKCNSIDNCNCF